MDRQDARAPAVFDAPNIDDLYNDLIDWVFVFPEHECAPRGQKIKEVIAPTLCLHDPRARIIGNPIRKVDYGFAVGEFLWYWAGKRDLETMLYYNKRMSQFSDDGSTLNSAYGYRTRERTVLTGGPNPSCHTQWEACKRVLLDDPDSRRALLVIGEPRDYAAGAYVSSKDLPCTLSLQFFIRERQLRLHVTMRSQDCFWGLPYDAFSFTLLQEAMTLELRAAGMSDLVLGPYTHTAGSMHIYERHFETSSAMRTAYLEGRFQPAAPMEPICLEGLALLAEQEEALRTGKRDTLDTTGMAGGIRWLGEQLLQHRRKRDTQRG